MTYHPYVQNLYGINAVVKIGQRPYGRSYVPILQSLSALPRLRLHIPCFCLSYSLPAHFDQVLVVTCNTGLGAPRKALSSICPWLPDLDYLLSPKLWSAQLITNRCTCLFSRPVPSLLQLSLFLLPTGSPMLSTCQPLQKPASHAYLHDSPCAACF